MAGNILGSLLLSIGTRANVSGVEKTDRSLRKLGKTAQNTVKQTGMLGKLTSTFFGGVNLDAVKRTAMQYLQFEKDIGAMKSRFFAITKDEKQAEKEYEYIRDLAISTANDVKSTADSYSIFYSSAKRALGAEGARGVFESWTKIGRVLHLNEQQFERVTYALREMSSKGQLYSQDLKMQLGTHVPDAVNIAETAIKNMNIAGVDTVEAFQKLTKKDPKSGYMAKFLVEFSKEAEKRFASPEAIKKALQQPDALEQQIRNLGFIFLDKFSRAGGRELTVKVLMGIYNLINKIDFTALTNTLGTIAKGIGAIFDYMPDILNILKDIAISVAIFHTIKGLFGAFKFLRAGFFALKQGKFINWMFLKVIGRETGLALLKGVGGKGLGALIANAIPFFGQVISILMLIWTAFDVLKLIYHIIKRDKEKKPTDLSTFLESQNVSSTNLLNTFRKIAELEKITGGKLGVQSAQNIASEYLGKDVAKTIQYNDRGQLTVHFNGNFLTMEDLMTQLNLAEKVDQEGNRVIYQRGGVYSPKPTSGQRQQFTWRG